MDLVALNRGLDLGTPLGTWIRQLPDMASGTGLDSGARMCIQGLMETEPHQPWTRMGRGWWVLGGGAGVGPWATHNLENGVV